MVRNREGLMYFIAPVSPPPTTTMGVEQGHGRGENIAGHFAEHLKGFLAATGSPSSVLRQ